MTLPQPKSGCGFFVLCPGLNFLTDFDCSCDSSFVPLPDPGKRLSEASSTGCVTDVAMSQWAGNSSDSLQMSVGKNKN